MFPRLRVKASWKFVCALVAMGIVVAAAWIRLGPVPADLLSPEAMAETLAKFRKRVRKAPLVMSGATGKGVREAMAKLLTEVDKRRPAPASRNGRDDHSGPDGPDEWHP